MAGAAGACSSSDAPAKATADAGLAQDANQIPCGPRKVMQAVCQQCHTIPQAQGAPFPLINRSDIFVNYQGAAINVLMTEDLNLHRMPLPPVTIEDDQRQTLLDWLNAGAFAVAAQACEGTADAGDIDEAGLDDAGSDANLDADALDAADAKIDAD